MIRLFFALLLFVVSALPPAHAHEKKQALTRMAVKADDAGMEIMHRFYVHDVESIARELLDRNVEFLTDPDAQAAFGQYLQDKFSVRTKEGIEIVLDYIGHEVEGKYFWVYQEIQTRVEVSKLEVSQKVLIDLLPEQRNLVNLERGGEVKSLYFSKHSDWQSFSLD